MEPSHALACSGRLYPEGIPTDLPWAVRLAATVAFGSHSTKEEYHESTGEAADT